MSLLPESAWSHVQHTSHGLAPLPTSVAVLVGLAMLVVVMWEEAWALTQHLNVVAHEGTHALVGWGAGRRVKSVKLTLNARGQAEGETGTLGPAKGLGRVCTSFCGYVGPSAFGLGGAKLIAMGYIQAVLWLTVVALAALVLFARNVRSFVSVVAIGGLAVLVLWRGQAGLQTVTSYGLTWFLLVSGVRVVVAHGPKAGDAGTLKKLTHVPRLVWFGVWLAGTLAALAAGGHLLL
jgi:hypothetical protein